MGSHSPLTPSSSSHGAVPLQFDPQHPFKGVVVCCTSIPPDERSEVDKRVVQLGGCHKYDLTPDVTHLVVGDYDTPKYRHVAKERPDVVPVAAGWIQAVMDLWKQDGEIDFGALENTWLLKPLESSGGPLLVSSADGAPQERGKLIVCLTGFDDPDERQNLITKINENGGIYTGDLTRKVTHLIVRKPEGRKYMAARNWKVKCVAAQWLHDSLSRGMILAEDCYDPLLPPEKLGEGAWTRKHVEKMALGKRLRDSSAGTKEAGVRKLRKTASMKLQSQSQHMWASILGASTPADPITVSRSDAPSQGGDYDPTQPNPRSMSATGTSSITKKDRPVFAACVLYVHGYNESHSAIVMNVIRGLGGHLCSSVEEVEAFQSPDITHRFLVVPQNSQPETHPQVPDGFHIVTEFYLEKCLHKKRFFDPNDHVLGRPFPAFPISKFMPLSIAIGGFTDVDLQQVEKAITQLGATFAERFTSKAHVLICNDLSAVRQKKVNLALNWQVPVVSADWLWDCIQTGSRVPLKRYLIPQLHQRVDTELPESPTNSSGSAQTSSFPGRHTATADGLKDGASLQRIRSDPVPRLEKYMRDKSIAKELRRPGLDSTAFDNSAANSDWGSFRTANTQLPASKTAASVKQSSSDSFRTAPAIQKAGSNANVGMGDGFRPCSNQGLIESTENALNRSPSPHKSNCKQTSKREDADKEMDSVNMEEKVHFPEIETPPLQGELKEPEAERTVREQAERHQEERRLAEEFRLEREARKKVERREIENKLMTAILLGDAAAATSGEANDGTEGGNGGQQVQTATGLGRKRKKGVFGRAVSNTSIVSSASEGIAPLPPPPLTKASTTTDSSLGNGECQEDSLMPDAPARPPPATQIGYAEPDERKQLLRKMKGEGVALDSDGTADEDGGARTSRRMESMTMGQYEKMREEEMLSNSSGRRARKRVPGF